MPYSAAFCAAIADATAPYCVAYKPNLAFFEAYGMPGLNAYIMLICHLREKYPHHFLIADAQKLQQEMAAELKKAGIV